MTSTLASHGSATHVSPMSAINGPPSTADAGDERIIDAVVSNTGLSREEAAAVVANSKKSAGRHFALKLQWVENLGAVTRAIVNDRAEPFGVIASVFWIRLYGVLTELRDDFKTWTLVRDDKPAPSPGLATMLASEKRVHEACAAVYASLDERELMFVALTRHTEAHVTQKGFAYGLERGSGKQRPAVRTKTRLEVLKEHRSVDEVMATCEALLAEHDGDQEALTKVIATKVAPHINDLVFVMRAHHKL